MIAICTMIRGYLPPTGDGAKYKDTTRQLRCHPPRGGGQTVNLPATMSWVGIVAQKAPAFSHSRKESNKTPTATPKPPPAQGAKRVEQK